MINTVAARLAGLSGWRRRFVWLISGAVAVLALPPFFVIPVLPVCFAVLLWSLEGVRCNKGALSAGWWFGTGHFAAGFYWVSHAFLVQPEIYGWMIPFALLGLGGGLAVFPMLAVWASWRLTDGLVRRAVLLAVFWAVAEYLRGHILTGFPWNLLAHIWAFDAAPMQFASVVGVYGLSVLTALFATLPATVIAGKRGRLAALAGVLIAVVLWGGGALRLSMVGPVQTDKIAQIDPNVPVVQIVQPNIAQRDKWRPDLQRQHFTKLIDMSRRPAGMDPAQKRIVIWPETAATFFVEDQPVARSQMADVLGPDDILITGAPRTYPRDTDEYKVWNAVQVVDSSGEIVASFDKFHLVPFGEYVPFRSILPFPKLTAGRTDFSAGPGPKTLEVPGIPSFSPLICYEVIFPGAVVDDANRPEWLLNVTNDGWFGKSAGPYQHLAAARFRSVEEGLPLIRAAYTGVSIMYDPYGRKLAELPLSTSNILVHPLLSNQNHTTVYSLWRDILFYGIVAFLAVLVMGYNRFLKSL
ncbi:apolipoprotein N-acyltransferase [Thalassospira sp. GB04J01]|jgi:apolipoprotein N-acyltransferase|uniref:apolipoprotein N-acyltransferase n=1 Tax=Thalassospira sp. GB04J01 TaxID=1485225 RepID=UPI000C9CB44D|nr:apolipoprotein N-acyltransferase [Thalassospira sp. GB04J01]|tara:strand:- start:2094 stop:3668 length:1575 start_codon:yes stop_codon:yes gene_type:complete